MISHFFRMLSPLLIVLSLAQCSSESTGRRLPRHSGEPGELLLIMNEKQWLGAPGDSLRTVFEAYYPFLPQAEPRFSLLQFSPEEMNSLLQQHRNIIQVIIGPDSEGANKVSLSRDRWSTHQLVFTIRAENEEKFYAMLPTEIKKLTELIDQAEVERIISRYRKTGNEDLSIELANKYGLDLAIPADMLLAKKSINFTWLKRERVKYLGNSPHDITQGLFVYTYPYRSEAQLRPDSILAQRDSLLKANVPGPKPGTYMATEYRLPPESEEIEINGRFAILTRGLWRTENYFMGGPFLNLTTTSADGNQIVCISGFVFAPKFDKREFIREVEAILRSVRIVEPSAKS